MGCYFARSPSLHELEKTLLNSTWEELAYSVEENNRPLDCIRAANLTAFYLFYKGCYKEAYDQASRGARLALFHGLHMIHNVVRWQGGERDGIEVGERVHTWWQVSHFIS